VPTSFQLAVEVIKHDVAQQRRERRPLRGAFLARRPSPISHDPGPQNAPDQPEHLLVIHPSCHPRHQRVVLNSVEERVEIEVDAPRLAI